MRACCTGWRRTGSDATKEERTQGLTVAAETSPASAFQREVTMDTVEIWIITRCQLLDLVSRAAKHLGTVSPGCGPEGRVGFLVGVIFRRVAAPNHRRPLSRLSDALRCVGVEAAARDGEHALTNEVDGPTVLQEHNDDE